MYAVCIICNCIKLYLNIGWCKINLKKFTVAVAVVIGNRLQFLFRSYTFMENIFKWLLFRQWKSSLSFYFYTHFTSRWVCDKRQTAFLILYFQGGKKLCTENERSTENDEKTKRDNWQYHMDALNNWWWALNFKCSNENLENEIDRYSKFDQKQFSFKFDRSIFDFGKTNSYIW